MNIISRTLKHILLITCTENWKVVDRLFSSFISDELLTNNLLATDSSAEKFHQTFSSICVKILEIVAIIEPLSSSSILLN
jgi:hypothetical protein